MKKIEDPRYTYDVDDKGCTKWERLIPCEPRRLRGQYMAKLVEQEINILSLTSTYMDKVGDDNRSFTEYFVSFEYAIRDSRFNNGKRWAKMALPIHVSFSDQDFESPNGVLPYPIEQIFGEVLTVVEEARKWVQD